MTSPMWLTGQVPAGHPCQSTWSPRKQSRLEQFVRGTLFLGSLVSWRAHLCVGWVILLLDCFLVSRRKVQTRRRLRNVLLSYLSTSKDAEAAALCSRHFRRAKGMTDKLAAFGCLCSMPDTDEAKEAVEMFLADAKGDANVIDKWFSSQARADVDNLLPRVKKLMEHPQFSLKNPNRLRSVISVFIMSPQFHLPDGSGYDFLTAPCLLNWQCVGMHSVLWRLQPALMKLKHACSPGTEDQPKTAAVCGVEPSCTCQTRRTRGDRLFQAVALGPSRPEGVRTWEFWGGFIKGFCGDSKVKLPVSGASMFQSSQLPGLSGLPPLPGRGPTRAFLFRRNHKNSGVSFRLRSPPPPPPPQKQEKYHQTMKATPKTGINKKSNVHNAF